jgi:4-hydroxy-3-methylbut-2-enyl diphosphate reductase
MPEQSKILIVANPRGFCAGVDRAIDTVEIALEMYKTPLYVKHAIVHNRHVVDRLSSRGVIFVDDLSLIPEGSRVIFSAHGSPLDDYAKAKEKHLEVIDATCPLVSKVHFEVQRFSREGFFVIMIGHKGHVEPIGTLSNAASERSFLIDSVEEARKVEIPANEKIAIVTQTTLSISETKNIFAELLRRFPHAEYPKKEDICYATTNRQSAVTDLAAVCEIVLIVGSKESSNANRLVEVARQNGAESYLIDDISQLSDSMYSKKNRIGISSGASTPDDLVNACINFFVKKGYTVKNQNFAKREDVVFSLPHGFVKEARRHESNAVKKHAIKQGRKMFV